MSKPEKHRVFVVDDHPLTRQGLCHAITMQDDLAVCGEAESWRDAIDKALSLKPDLIVLDLNLKDGSGWEVLRRLEAANWKTAVLVLSVCDEAVYAQRMLQSGAKGYLMKDTPIDKILEAIRKILAGHIAVSDAVASRLIHAATHRKADPDHELGILSDRELQVLEFLRRGLTNPDIARSMGISPKTISTYKARLMEKLGIRTSPELLDYITRQVTDHEDRNRPPHE